MSVPEAPTLMKNSLLGAIAMFWHHRDKLPFLFKKCFEIWRDGQANKARSLSNDVISLNNVFKTKIQIDGTKNIPPTGGMVLVMSHVVSTSKFPGWLNQDVNPLWWTSGITTGVKRVRNDEIRPITSYRGDQYGIYYRLIQSLYQGFPVRQIPSAKTLNRKSLIEARKAVKSGAIVLIAPEGKNMTALSQANIGGLGRLISKGVPFVPVSYFEQQTESGYKYVVRFGKPVFCQLEVRQTENGHDEVPLTKKDKQQVQTFVDDLMIRIAQLLPEEKRGVYKLKERANEVNSTMTVTLKS